MRQAISCDPTCAAHRARISLDMLATGIDIIEISRIRASLEKFGDRFLERVYTQPEAALYRKRPHDLAARFAGKEAVMKALGTGAKGIGWKEIEILPNQRGKPLVYLHGRATERAKEMGLEGIDVSLSHSRDLAVAIAVGTVASQVEEGGELPRELILAVLRGRGVLR